MSMTPRIEIAEILSFKLKVPRADLEALPGNTAGLKLALAIEDNDLLLSALDNDSSLRFRSIGTEVILTEIALQHDERGQFFQKVLGPLMVRFGGDLHARLSWNDMERNSHGDYAEVRISRGQTTYPGLSAAPLLSADASGGAVETTPSSEGEPPSPEPLTKDEQEIFRLLEKARAHWAEYQRLKK